MTKLKIVLLITISAVIIIGSLLTFRPLQKITYSYIPNASLISYRNLEIIKSPLDSKRLRRSECSKILGQNHALENTTEKITLVIFSESEGKRWALDDDEYERVTISIKDAKENRMYNFLSDDLNLYYSKAGTTWVPQCSGWYADEGRGTVLLKKIDNEFVIALLTIEGTAAPASKLLDKSKFQYFGEYIFRKERINNMNAWAMSWRSE